ncbi:hypothetical protein [Chryseobacterium sp. RR2-3-20]|uniref:hypothetical protein n=1 Tax=Chryseobacterium sp. RR2-3-20 TaxID=2787626 RepID=UPI001ADEED7B|nr:hypothetical protein [Chryseobacterium sp. RR2-3-20]
MSIYKNIFFLFLLSLGIFTFSQEKKKFPNVENVLLNIKPDSKLDFWVLVHNHYGKGKEIKVSGTKKDYVPQFSGFNLRPGEDSFFYIVYSSGGKISYITELKDLKNFIGKIDNVDEAALSAVLEGYMIDEQFVDVAANYYEDKTNYYLDLGKITSTECPYQKKHFTLTVNKSSGMITNVKENGTYTEVYTKKCTNNPRLQKKQPEETPKETPKKAPKKRR